MRIYTSPTAGRDLPLAVAAAATTWLTMWSWRGFSADWGAFIGPLLVVAMTVSLGGVALRCSRLPERASATLHVLVVLAVVWMVLGGSVIHPLASTDNIVTAIRDAWASAATNVAPVPDTAPSIAPLVIVCGAGVLLLVDVLACQRRLVPLAGLPLLAVHAVPIIGLDDAVSWPVFAMAAAGFLLMMYLQQSEHVSRWRGPLHTTSAAGPNALDERTGTLRNRAGLIGAGAVLLAVTLPMFIPTANLNAGKVFHAGGHGHSARFTDLFTTMRLGLHRGTDLPLLDVVTDDPHPSYLRLGVLTRFDGEQWTNGSRDFGHRVNGDGTIPVLEQGLATGALETSYQYQVTATNSFDSTWLPTQFPVSRIVAPGTWDYDPATMDVFAGDAKTNAAGITYQMTAEVPRLSARSLSHALPAPPDILAAYTTPADSLPPQVHSFAVEATRGTRNPYRMAVRLQDWFRWTGGFRYNLSARSGDDGNALVDFLTPGPGGRVGYCEQFASAYAAMAQVLGIPARVAVGYLSPTQGRDGDWIYSAWDYHAWPELYFQGSGWVRFEPTPAARGTSVPPWTATSNAMTTVSGGQPSSGASVGRPTANQKHTQQLETRTTTASTPADTGVGRSALYEALGGLVVLAVLVQIPGAVRRSRRNRRLTGGAEDAWAELRDTALDLGVAWPAGRSPHETAVRLADWFAEHGCQAPARALDRIVLMLEQVRYARSASDAPGVLAGDIRTCIQAFEQGCRRAALVRARWLPRSVFAQSARFGRAEREHEATSDPRVHDYVG